MLPLYATDVQPQSLKSLALNSLIKNFPGLSDLPADQLKQLGIPPLIVDAAEERPHDAESVIDLDQGPVFSFTLIEH